MNYDLRMKNEAGQSLAEILIAIGLGMVVLTAMAVSVIAGLSNANLSKNQNLATEFAQEGMEIVKQMQLTEYGTFQNLASNRYCLADTCSILDSGTPGCWVNTNGSGGTNSDCAPNVNNQAFIREVDISQPTTPLAGTKCNNTTIQATVSVLWSDAKCQSGVFCHEEQVVSCFSNPNPIGSP